MVDTNEVESHLIDRYEIRRRLGKGAYGIVWKANERKSGRVVALKKIFDAFRNATDAQRTFREILFLQEFSDHQNIIKLLNVVAAKNDKDIYLVFEYMDTDLHAVIRKGGILQDAHQRYIMAQLLRATAYLHSGNVIHRDHKPSNILLDSDCLVKICDFGLARSLSQLPVAGKGESDESVPALTEYVATRWYRAPEILLSSPHYTKGVDMWSLGCILAEMLLGKPLFPGDSTFDQIEKIIRVIPTPNKNDIETIGSQYAQTVIDRAQRKNKKSLVDIMPNTTPPDGIHLIEQLLVFNPEKRPSASSCLKNSYVSRFHSKKENLNLGYNVIPPINDDIQLSVDEYRDRLYAMIKQRKQAQKEEKLRKENEKASGDHKDPNETITDNNNTLTEEEVVQVARGDHGNPAVSPNRPGGRTGVGYSATVGQTGSGGNQPDVGDRKSKRYSRSAHNQTGSKTGNEIGNHQNKQENRHKSAPISRNIQSREISRNYDASHGNEALMRKTATKMSDLSVSGKIVQQTNKQINKYKQTNSQSPQKQQKRFSSSIHKNNSSSSLAKKSIGASHNQQYGTVSAQFLRDYR
jgi:mitogen-activated protein kinase 15